jgi:hypothetical protein
VSWTLLKGMGSVVCALVSERRLVVRREELRVRSSKLWPSSGGARLCDAEEGEHFVRGEKTDIPVSRVVLFMESKVSR